MVEIFPLHYEQQESPTFSECCVFHTSLTFVPFLHYSSSESMVSGSMEYLFKHVSMLFARLQPQAGTQGCLWLTHTQLSEHVFEHSQMRSFSSSGALQPCDMAFGMSLPDSCCQPFSVGFPNSWRPMWANFQILSWNATRWTWSRKLSSVGGSFFPGTLDFWHEAMEQRSLLRLLATSVLVDMCCHGNMIFIPDRTITVVKTE